MFLTALKKNVRNQLFELYYVRIGKSFILIWWIDGSLSFFQLFYVLVNKYIK